MGEEGGRSNNAFRLMCGAIDKHEIAYAYVCILSMCVRIYIPATVDSADGVYNPIEVNVQQPFVFCIVDSQTDLIIMIGQIVNPLSSRIL